MIHYLLLTINTFAVMELLVRYGRSGHFVDLVLGMANLWCVIAVTALLFQPRS